MIDPLELAYFAGFFDGEGSIGIYRKKYITCIVNCDPRQLQRAKELWGGNIYTVTRMVSSHRNKYTWQICGEYGRKFLEDIRPYSRIKKDQIDIYLSVLGIVPLGHGTQKQRDAVNVVNLAAVRLKQLKKMEF